MSQTIDVLLIDAAPGAEQFWQPLFEPSVRQTYRVQTASSLDEAFSRIPNTLFDVLLLDLVHRAELPRLRTKAVEASIIVIASKAQEEHAILTLQTGAQDYLLREELTPALLSRSIRYSTERQRSQAAIARAEEKFRSLFENTVEGIFQTTPKGAYINANSALARIYGYDSPAELKAKLTNIAQELYVERGRRDEFIKLMEENDVVKNFESRIYRKDGTIIWIAENVRAVRDSDDNLLHYEGTVEDITAQKQSEQQLRDSETLYHSLVETLPSRNRKCARGRCWH